MKIDRTAPRRIDRRVVRTRGQLQDALIALIPERGYAAMTVEDLCQSADVGRSTFYAHYTGKDALLRATIDAHLQALALRRVADAPETRDLLFEFSRPMFEHAREFQSLHHALLAGGDDFIHDQFRELIRGAVRHEMTQKRIGCEGIPAEMAVQYVAGAFLSVLTWWIAGDSDLASADIDDMFQQLARHGVGKALRQGPDAPNVSSSHFPAGS